MADNVTLDSMSGGDVIAADDITSVKFQRIKLVHGADGVNAGDVSTSNGLPVLLVTGSATIGVLGANSGVDIGDVTINNASGGSAVNVQDGGNSLTVDFLGQIVDDAAFTPGSTTVHMAGFTFDDVSPDSVNEGDGGAARMSANRNIYTNLRDGWQQKEFGASVDYMGRQTVYPATDAVTVSGNVPLAIQRQPVNTSTTGATVISGQANRKIRVLNGVLMAPTAVTVQLKSANNSDVTGPLAVGATGGFQIPEAEIGNFETQTGQALTIVLSSAVQVGGWLSFVYV